MSLLALLISAMVVLCWPNSHANAETFRSLVEQGFQVVGTFGAFSSASPMRSLEIAAKQRLEPDETTYSVLLQKDSEVFLCRVVVSNAFWDGVESSNEVVMKLEKPSSHCFSITVTK